MSQIQLRGGFTATDPRLGRLPEFDDRSRDFPVRAMLTSRQETELGGKTWYLRVLLDQLYTSGCTGHSRAYDLAASPMPLRKPDRTDLDFNFADSLYRLAQTLDEWPGEAYEGSSVLGACKAAERLGFIGEYRWAFGIDDVCAALSWLGPVVVGTDWLESMFYADRTGLVRVEGGPNEVAGGHAYTFRGIIVSRDSQRRYLGRGVPLREGIPLLRGRNSWGWTWGMGGEFFMWADDLERLLHGVAYRGEASINTSPFIRA